MKWFLQCDSWWREHGVMGQRTTGYSHRTSNSCKCFQPGLHRPHFWLWAQSILGVLLTTNVKNFFSRIFTILGLRMIVCASCFTVFGMNSHGVTTLNMWSSDTSE